VKNNTLAKIAICLVLLTPLFILYYSGLSDHISITSLKANKDFLHSFVLNNYLLSVCYYIGVYAVVGACSFPFVSLITIMGGFLFGTVPGVIYTNVGATTGGLVAFLSYRYLFGEWVRTQYGHRLVTFNAEIKHNGAWYLVMMRLIIVIPFFVANALASVAPISIQTFIWTTSVGIIPSTLIYSFAGEQLDTISSVRDIFSVKVICAFALLALLTVVSLLLRRVWAKKIQ